MTKMTAATAAMCVMEQEGVRCAFGVPGAAINPLYAALRPRNEIRHFLARHVEGASHMAEGYTRAKPGNIGVCIGTSGPAGTDMITGLYSAWADSISNPLYHWTSAACPAPQRRLSGGGHRVDRQAGDKMGGHGAGACACASGFPAGISPHALWPSRARAH